MVNPIINTKASCIKGNVFNKFNPRLIKPMIRIRVNNIVLMSMSMIIVGGVIARWI